MAEVRPLERNLWDAYDSFLLENEHSLVYYSIKYKAFLEELLNCTSRHVVAVEDEQVTGLLPVMELSGPRGRVINSLPYYGSNGGVLAATRNAREALVRHFDALASEPDVVAATWVENPLVRDATPTHDFVDTRIGQLTSLERVVNETDLMARIDGSARRNVRKARASGVNVAVDNDAFAFLQEVHRENMQAIGGKSKNDEFFRLVPKHFRAGSDFNLFVASRGHRLVAALLLLYFNRTVEYFVPVTRLEERSSQPMALILTHAMLDAAHRGFARWNWGGTWLTQPGVGRFKRKWGARDLEYHYFVRVNDKQLLSSSSKDLIAEYPGFYVVPFERLHPKE